MHFVPAGACIRAVVDVDRRLFAQLGEIFAQFWLHSLQKDSLFHLRLHLLEAGVPAKVMLCGLQDDESLLGADRLRVLTGIQGKGLISDLFCQLVAAKFT